RSHPVCFTRRWSKDCRPRYSRAWPTAFHFLSASACQRNMPRWSNTSPPTASSTARRSGWMAPCGWHRVKLRRSHRSDDAHDPTSDKQIGDSRKAKELRRVPADRCSTGGCRGTGDHEQRIHDVVCRNHTRALGWGRPILNDREERHRENTTARSKQEQV